MAFDGTLRAPTVAYAIAGWMLDSIRAKKVMRLGQYVDCYLFGSKNRAVAVLWDRRPCHSKPQNQVVFPLKYILPEAYDIMGNPFKPLTRAKFRIARVGPLPVYLKWSNSEELYKLLREAKVISSGEGAFVVGRTLRLNREGEPALLLKIYNNSLDKKTGTISFPEAPVGFSLAEEERSFTIAPNGQVLFTFP